MQRRENVGENVVGYLSSLRDSFRLIKGPVNAEIDTALTVLFLCLRERGEGARKIRACYAVVAPRESIEFVGDKGKRDGVSPIELAQGLEKRAAESGMA